MSTLARVARLALGGGRAPMLRAALTPASPPRGGVLSALRCGAVSPPRFCSGKPADEAAKPEASPSDVPELVYEGAKNKIVKTLKMASIANLAFALASAPILQYITSAAGASGKGVAMSGLVSARPARAPRAATLSPPPNECLTPFPCATHSSSSLAGARRGR